MPFCNTHTHMNMLLNHYMEVQSTPRFQHNGHPYYIGHVIFLNQTLSVSLEYNKVFRSRTDGLNSKLLYSLQSQDFKDQ